MFKWIIIGFAGVGAWYITGLIYEYIVKLKNKLKNK